MTTDLEHNLSSRMLSQMRTMFSWKAFFVAVAVSLITIAYPLLTFGDLTTRIVFCKILQFLIVYMCAYAIEAFFRKRKANASLDLGLKAFGLFFVLYFVVFVVLYPGGWHSDDMNIYQQMTQDGTWPVWQNYLTAVFYMLCYITIPIPSFAVFVQFVLLCVIASYIAYRVSVITPVSKKAILVIGAVIMLLPPMLNMNFYPLRAALHSYLEVLVLFLFFDHFVSKRPWTPTGIIVVALLGAIVCMLRTECLVFVLAFPLLFFVLSPDRTKRLKQTGVFFCVLVLTTGALNWYQSKNISGEYALTAYTPALIAYAHQASVDDDRETLDELKKAYDVDVLNKAYDANMTGETLYWVSTYDPEWEFRAKPADMSDDEYGKLCRNVFISCSLQNPALLLDSKVQLVDKGIAKTYAPYLTSDLSDREAFLDRYPLNRMLVPEWRELFTNFFEAQAGFEWISVFYNLYLLIPIYIIAITYLLIRRSRLSLIPITLVLQALLIMLAGPAYYFMYYYAFYLAGILMAVWLFCAFFGWLRSKRFLPHEGIRESAVSANHGE